MDRAVSSLLSLHGFMLHDFDLVEFVSFWKHAGGSVWVLRACGFRISGFRDHVGL